MQNSAHIYIYIYIYIYIWLTSKTSWQRSYTKFGPSVKLRTPSDTFGHCSVFSFSWKSLKMEQKKEPKDPQTIHEYLLLLLSTHQALKLKLWHVLKMSTKAHLGFEEALPFGQASDNLRTLFALFKTVSGNWEGQCSRGSLGEHMGVGVGVGVWG